MIVGFSACRPPGVPRTPPPPSEPPAVPAITDAARRDSATAASAQHLSLADVVDLALRNNPSTRESWENALAAADVYGSARGACYPTINASINATQFTGSGFGGFGGIGGFETTPVDTTQGGRAADAAARPPVHKPCCKT